jgi:hypothetical protein
LAQAADGGIQAHVEIDDRAIIPKPAPQVIARNQFTGSIEQCNQNLHRLLSQANRVSVFAQSSTGCIRLERPESHVHQAIIYINKLRVNV